MHILKKGTLEEAKAAKEILASEVDELEDYMRKVVIETK
jgi:hypothetical protein